MTMVVLQQQQQQQQNKKMMWSWDWAGLPDNILDEILDRLVALSDYIRFASVCVSWRSAALDNRNHRGNRKKNQLCLNLEDHHQLPMLMVPHRSDEDRAQFYSVAHEKILDFQLRVPYYTKRFIGSSFGWLICVHTTDLAITLFNTFSASTIHLPPFPISPPKQDYLFDYETIHLPQLNLEYYFIKAILSADPAAHPSDYVVMVIHGRSRRLAYIRPGAGADHWTYFQPPSIMLIGFCDVIYSKSSRLFYALHMAGDVCSINIDREEKADWFTPTLEIGHPLDLRYFAETRAGDLLQVYRFIHDSSSRSVRTRQIKVFKLDKTTTMPVWVELKSLGDNALFVGDCTSICVAASDFPGCRPGSIYFSLPFLSTLLVEQKPFRSRSSYDMGVSNIEEQGKPVQPFHINYRRYRDDDINYRHRYQYDDINHAADADMMTLTTADIDMMPLMQFLTDPLFGFFQPFVSKT